MTPLVLILVADSELVVVLDSTKANLIYWLVFDLLPRVEWENLIIRWILLVVFIAAT